MGDAGSARAWRAPRRQDRTAASRCPALRSHEVRSDCHSHWEASHTFASRSRPVLLPTCSLLGATRLRRSAPTTEVLPTAQVPIQARRHGVAA
eukprot:5842007-Prymnesium_polylepis.1